MFHLVAKDPAAGLSEDQARRIQHVLMELIPARGCRMRRDPPIEIWVVGHQSAQLHPPLVERVEAIAGCPFTVTVEVD